MKATVYDPITGQILRTLSAAFQRDIDLNIRHDELWIAGEYDPETFYIKNGTVVKKPERPNYPAEFDCAAEVWVWNEEESWNQLRLQRNRLLAASDWTQIPDAPVDSAVWAIYRQSLRDMPENTSDPRNPVWPTPPST